MKGIVKKWGINGEGVVYLNRKAVFVDGVVPGEDIEYELSENNDTWARGKVLKILNPSPRRHEPSCPYAKECGGCSIMHLDYKGQIRMKEAVLRDTLRKYAGYEGKIEPMIKNPSPLMYRNSCKLPFGVQDGKIITGMYQRNTNKFVPIPRCLVHSKLLEKTRQEIMRILENYDLLVFSEEHEGLITLVLREFDGKVHAVFVTTEMEIPESLINALLESSLPVASVWQSIKSPKDPAYELFGDKVLHLGGAMNIQVPLEPLSLSLLPRSFFQLNTAQAQNLYKTVTDWIEGNPELVVEAYSGIGAMSLMAASKAKEVTGIEVVEDAVVNARDNALANGIENASFVCGDAGQELEEIAQKKTIDVLIADPPRSGLDQKMIDSILKAAPNEMIYVSCNPATLAKNLKELEGMYQVERVQPFDMFSQSPQIETAVLLKKRAFPIKTAFADTSGTKQKAERKTQSRTSENKKPFYKKKMDEKRSGKKQAFTRQSSKPQRKSKFGRKNPV